MNDEESSIEKLKRALYSRDEKMVPKERRTAVHGEERDVPKNWGEPDSLSISPEELVRYQNMSQKGKNSFFNKFLIGSIGFFFVALAITVFVFMGGMNLISSNNVDMTITAPSSVSSGEELDLDISVINQNRTDLDNAVLSIDYPEGSKSIKDGSVLSREKVDLGVIPHGSKKEETVRMVLFGEKDSIKTVTLKLDYGVKGSDATFSKQKKYEVTIGSSPILINVSYPPEINSGQDVTFTLDVTSNSPVPVQNLLVKAEYPYGFTFGSSNMKAIDGNNTIWNVGDLQNGNKKTLIVSGTLVGQDKEDRSFRFSAGTADTDKSDRFTTALARAESLVGIRKSFFGLSVSSTNGGMVNPNQPTAVTISWQNTLPEKLVGNHMEAKLSGNIFDRTAVAPGNGGFYRSSDSTVLWDKNNNSNFSEINPGDTGQVIFTVVPIKINPQVQLIKNPHIDIAVNITGAKSVSDGETVSSNSNYTIKIPTTLAIISESFRNSGPFSNTGPIPPVSDKETTYTVTWTVTNTFNDVKEAFATTVLPAGVEWKGQTSPTSEKISYNPDNRSIVWNVGNISAGVGYSYAPRTVSFQVGLTPSANQSGTVLPLTSGVSLRGTDTYTAGSLMVGAQAVSTHFSDQTFIQGQEIVGK